MSATTNEYCGGRCQPGGTGKRQLALERSAGRTGGLRLPMPPNASTLVKPAALIVSLIGAAYLMALAIGSPERPWLGWLTLLPLFVAIRACRPLNALLSGGLWGLSLYLFSVTTVDSGVSPGVFSLALFTAIPAIYAYLGSRLTRWVGFNPFVLGVAWMGVELAFAPLGLRHGLLAGAQGDTTLMHWIGGALGYVLVAFVVALVSASLVSALGAVHLRFPRPLRLTRSDDGGGRLVPQTFSCFPLFAIPPSRPRAPPIESAAMA